MSESRQEVLPAKGQPSTGEQRRFVSFRLDQDAFALPLERVERALRMVATVQLPETPSWMLGVINMHGQVLPVLDLGQRFGREAKEPHPDQRLLVVSQEPRNVALLVDKVERVLNSQEGRLEPPSGHLAGSRVLAGVLKHEDELVLVLDPDRLAPIDWEKHEELFKAMEQEAALKEQLESPK
ncbi:MAG: chemotaxis protein CheW [Desulfarculaceae bacterium]|nr:chemotaxis protein CheW [Desulfarculaceae bacterium]MCF8047976.1 chemotaxis protein CheW [Desulfarculaceae bacterium]MCF8098160.1 chemotaxis protein CheW [Desulfarculaceae bacterium]MCF8124003.1 chemotaxis protein CheW [Desulfarculaceae bacterium]